MEEVRCLNASMAPAETAGIQSHHRYAIGVLSILVFVFAWKTIGGQQNGIDTDIELVALAMYIRAWKQMFKRKQIGVEQ